MPYNMSVRPLFEDNFLAARLIRYVISQPASQDDVINYRVTHFVKLITQVRTQLYTAALSRQLERPWRVTFTSKPTSSNLRDARTASTPARPLRENSASDATVALDTLMSIGTKNVTKNYFSCLLCKASKYFPGLKILRRALKIYCRVDEMKKYLGSLNLSDDCEIDC